MLHVNITKQLSHFKLDVSFHADNEIVVLFGSSGSGKTTILNIIAGISKPATGNISLDNVPFFNQTNKPLPIQKREVGYLFQDYALFPHMTIKKNILYGARRKGFTIDSPFLEKLLDVMGIKHLLNKYPKNISGGEKQRVALARAIATQPKLLLLDEPFSALDKQTKDECHNELLHLHKLWNIPVILVTHDLEEAKKLGNRILYLEKGELVERLSYDLKFPPKQTREYQSNFSLI